jgi:hypothetical protein
MPQTFTQTPKKNSANFPAFPGTDRVLDQFGSVDGTIVHVEHNEATLLFGNDESEGFIKVEY